MAKILTFLNRKRPSKTLASIIQKVKIQNAFAEIFRTQRNSEPLILRKRKLDLRFTIQRNS